MPSGGIQYPGLEGTIDWQFTLSAGIVPSTGVIKFPAGVGTPRETGDMVITFGSERIRFRDCRIGSASYSAAASGKTITIQILDRRWKWAFGRIDGYYNARRPNGEVDPDYEKTPQELAKLLFKAMGEPNGDASALPNFARPEVDWIAANPAQELQSLADQFGCRIVWNPQDDRVRIVRQGQGRQLPDGGTVSRGDGVDPDEKPDWLDFVAGPTRHQCQLKLEAVGLDVDETIKPIDDLSYRPPSGWGNEWPEVMAGVSDRTITLDDDTKTTPRNLALQTVFRWYRVTDKQRIPDVDGDVSRKELLPIPSTLVDTYEDADGAKVSKPAYLVGVGWHEGLPLYRNTEDGTKLNIQVDQQTGIENVASFSIDAEKGIVKLGRPIVKLDTEAGTIGPAEMRLVTAVKVRDKETHHVKRYTRSRAMGRNPSQRSASRQVVRRDEIELTVTGFYTDSGNLIDQSTNETEVQRQADYYLNGAAADYDSPITDDRTYPGIRLIELDGAIQQVTWAYSASGYFTRASRGTEHNRSRPTYKEFVKLQQLSNTTIQAQKENSKAAAKKLAKVT